MADTDNIKSTEEKNRIIELHFTFIFTKTDIITIIMQRLLFLISCLLAIWGAQSFAPQKLSVTQAPFRQISSLNAGGEGETKTTTAEDSKRRIVGKKIIVKGDVNSGYVRTCISNEVRCTNLLVLLFNTTY